MNQPKREWQEKLRALGFGNAARIVGTKRVELYDLISQIESIAEERGREAEQKRKPQYPLGIIGDAAAIAYLGSCLVYLADSLTPTETKGE